MIAIEAEGLRKSFGAARRRGPGWRGAAQRGASQCQTGR